MLPDIGTEEMQLVVEQVAEDVLASCGLSPPVDCLALAERLKLTVAWDETQQARARYVGPGLGGTACLGAARLGAILLRPEPRAERRQWAVAHEIGEHFAWRVFAELSVDPRAAADGARESVANRLAGALLVPLGHFAADAADCDWDLLALKRRYVSASHELLARRMLDCSPPAIVTIFDHGRRTARLGNTGAAPPVLWPVELRAWRDAHDGGVCSRRQSDGVTVQAWPIHEPGWRREILRTVVDEWCEGEERFEV